MAGSLVSATVFSVTFLSPVHVGAEERLGDHDVLYLGGTLYRVTAERLLAELERDPQLRDRYLTGGLRAIEQWLRQGDRLRRLAAYESPVPRDRRRGEDVRPFLSDPLGRPYLPGTELKGAVRTAVLWDLVGRHPERTRLAARVGKREWRGQPEDQRDHRFAGQWLEQTLLGREPRADAFRILRVTDTEPLPARSIKVYPVLVAGRHRDGLRVMQRPRLGQSPSSYADDPVDAVATFCECLDSGEPRTRVELDRYLLGTWDRDASFVTRWQEACNTFSRHVAEAERAWWTEAETSAPHRLRSLAASLAEFYAQLLRRLASLPAGQAVLDLGWGGGWRTKSVAEQFGPSVVAEVVRRYNLDRGSRGPVFPKTRKVAWMGGDRYAPLGWILLHSAGGG
jgi:CRISPR-associated protein Csm5